MRSGIACVATPRNCPHGARAKVHLLFPDRPLGGDAVSHEVTWRNRSMETLRHHMIRLEFLLTKADLYTFRATGEKED